MADILAAFDQLESQDKKKKASGSKKTPEQILAETTRRNARRASATPRPQSRPISRASSRSGATTPPNNGAPPQSPTHLSPDGSARAGRSISIATQPSREQSTGAESRRISFAEIPQAKTRYQVKIATKNDSLSSGFPYDGQKLIKYEVSSKEWSHFSGEVIVACDAHHYSQLTWPLHRSKVIKKVRNDLKYGQGPDPGDVSKVFRKWNRLFRRQGFMASMELPSEEGAEELGRSTAGMNKEDQKQAQKEAKRFRIVISPLDNKGGSIYSKSSIRASVSEEGNIVKRANTVLSSLTKSSHDAVKEIHIKEEDEEEQKPASKVVESKQETANADSDKENAPTSNGVATGEQAGDKVEVTEETKD